MRCIHCAGGPDECIEAQDMLQLLYESDYEDIIKDNIRVTDEKDCELSIGAMKTRSHKHQVSKGDCTFGTGPKCAPCVGNAEIFEKKLHELLRTFFMSPISQESVPIFSTYQPILPLVVPE